MLTATSVVAGVTASAIPASGAVRTVTPRRSCTSQGKRFDVKSTSGTSTSARSGREAATIATSSDTVAPAATSSGRQPTRRAKDSRARPTDSVQGSQLVRPSRQSARAAWSASNAGFGGSP